MNRNLTLVTVIRHGETEWNILGKHQGCLDSPLTEKGIRQAERSGRALKSDTFNCLYSSDLGRAVQTGEILAKELSLKIIFDTRLRERNLGIIQGLTADEIKKKYPEEYQRYNLDDLDYTPLNGESFREFFERSIMCFKEIVKRQRNEHILVVTHGLVLNNLLRWVLEIPIEKKRRFTLKNCSINRFIIKDDIWKLDTWGQVVD